MINSSLFFSARYEGTNEAFSLPVSSIISPGTKPSQKDVQIPLKVFRGKVDRGNHSAVIGVPILYVRNRYYLVPAFGAVNNNADEVAHTLEHPSEEFAKKRTDHSDRAKATDFGIDSKTYPLKLEMVKAFAKSPSKQPTVESLNQNPHPMGNADTKSTGRNPTEALLRGAVIKSSTVAAKEQPCVEQSSDLQICGGIASKKQDIVPTSSLLKTLTDEHHLVDFLNYSTHGSLGGLQGALGSDRYAEVIEKFYKSPEQNALLKIKSEEAIRSRRRNIPHPPVFEEVQEDEETYKDKYEKSDIPEIPMNGEETTNLVNKLVGTPDLSSVVEELKIARNTDFNPKSYIINQSPSSMSKTVSADRRTFFDTSDYARNEGIDYQHNNPFSEENPSATAMRGYPDGDNSFQTIGVSKGFDNSLSSFLNKNVKPDDEMASDGNSQRRYFNDDTSYRKSDDNYRDYSNHATDSETDNERDGRSFFTHPDRYPDSKDSYNDDSSHPVNRYNSNEFPDTSYNSNEGSYTNRDEYSRTISNNENSPFNERNSLPNSRETNEVSYFNPEVNSGPIPDSISNVHDMSSDEVDYSKSKNFQSTTPEAIHFGLQQNLAQSETPGDMSMLDNAANNSPSDATYNDYSRDAAAAVSRGHVAPRAHSVQEIINQISHVGLGNGLLHTAEPSPLSDHQDKFAMRGERTSISSHEDNDSLEDVNPRLADRISRLRAETKEMEREYEVLKQRFNNRYNNLADQESSRTQMYGQGDRREHAPNADFGPEIINDLGTAEAEREKQLYEINKFAGRELSSLPKFDAMHDSLNSKSPDELLEYARQNTAQTSNQYGQNQNEMPGRAFFRSSPERTELGMGRMNIDASSLFNRLNSRTSPDYQHHPAEYLAEVLHKLASSGAARRSEQGSFDRTALKALYEYLIKGGQSNHGKLPPGSLAAVTSDGGTSPLRLVPSVNRNYNDNTMFARRNFQNQNGFHRADIPHPGNESTEKMIPSLTNKTSKSVFNMTRSNIADFIDDPGRFVKRVLNHKNSTAVEKKSNVTATKSHKELTKYEQERVIKALKDISNIQFDKVQKGLDEVLTRVQTMFHSKRNQTMNQTVDINAHKRSEQLQLIKLYLSLRGQAEQAKKSYVYAKRRLSEMKRWQIDRYTKDHIHKVGNHNITAGTLDKVGNHTTVTTAVSTADKSKINLMETLQTVEAKPNSTTHA